MEFVDRVERRLKQGTRSAVSYARGVWAQAFINPERLTREVQERIWAWDESGRVWALLVSRQFIEDQVLKLWYGLQQGTGIGVSETSACQIIALSAAMLAWLERR